jgi:hypothetical protein
MSQAIQNLVQRFVQYFALLFLGISHFLKQQYRENEQARVVIDFMIALFIGFKEIIHGKRPSLPDSEKWSEWIYYDFRTRTVKDVFDPPVNLPMDGEGVRISKVNSSVYLVSIDGTQTTEIEVSRERFITIQYIHPHMALPLTLEIPPGMYQQGNALFSSSFVYWCLKYQYLSTEYVFDENYKLDLIDSDMNMISLNTNQYIILEGVRGYRKGVINRT